MRIEIVASALIICLVLNPSPAYGYLDPATGSMLWQIVVGGLVAGLATVKMYWRSIRSFLARSSAGPPTGGSGSDS